MAALRLLTKPHDVINIGHIAYDVCKLSYLVGKGVLRKVVQVKDCILALKELEMVSEVQETPGKEGKEQPVAEKLQRSFQEVDTSAIDAQLDMIDVEDGWVLVVRRAVDQKEFSEEQSRAMLATSQHMQCDVQSLAESHIEPIELCKATLICPLTLEPIEDAVIAPSGTVFERRAILSHLNTSYNCPVTSHALSANQLQPFQCSL